MALDLNIYRASSRTLSVLPCASLERGCDLHASGRNQPCLGTATSTANLKSDSTTGSPPRRPSPRISTLPTGFSSRILDLGRYGNFKANRIATQAEDARTTPLFTLPVELLQAIALLLPPSSFVSLTLTCTALVNTLGTRHWADSCRCIDDEAEYYKLLILLHRDQPTYRLCRPCQRLHSPTNSTISLPRNVLTRRGEASPVMRRTALYIMEPGPWGTYSYRKIEGRTRRPAYWLSDSHIEAAIAKQICLATLTCNAKYAIPITIDNVVFDQPSRYLLRTAATLNFEYAVVPLLVRKHLLLCETTFTFSFEFNLASLAACPKIEKLEAHHEDGVKDILAQCTDMRPCIHAPPSLLVEEITCCLFHWWLGSPHRGFAACDRYPGPHKHGLDPNTSASAPSPALSKHKKALEDWYSHRTCDCAVEFEMSITGLDGTAPGRPSSPFSKMEIKIWNVFGEKVGERDAVLRLPGVLRELWRDEFWRADEGGAMFAE